MSAGGGKKFFEAPDKDKCRDSGLALILIGLIVILLGDVWHKVGSLQGSISLVPWLALITLLVMACPTVFKPWAYVWFGVSELLGAVMSKVILSIAFFLVVTPVGLLRSLSGKDTLQLKKWKSGQESVYRNVDRKVEAADLEHMF